MAPLHRLSAEHAARHRERSVVAEIACTDTHQIDLPHQLIVRTQQKVILRKLIQRRKFRHTGCRYNRIHRPDGLVQFLDGIGGADIYPQIAELVPHLDDLMPQRQLFHNGSPDRPCLADNHHFHNDLPPMPDVDRRYRPYSAVSVAFASLGT